MNGERLEPPTPLAWYPQRLAWHFSFSRVQLRKLPVLAEVHEMIKREDAAGSITRQEAVSMIPPLLLDVRSHHTVGAPQQRCGLEAVHLSRAEGPSMICTGGPGLLCPPGCLSCLAAPHEAVGMIPPSLLDGRSHHTVGAGCIALPQRHRAPASQP